MLVVGPKFKLKFTTFQIYALKKSLVANKLQNFLKLKLGPDDLNFKTFMISYLGACKQKFCFQNIIKGSRHVNNAGETFSELVSSSDIRFTIFVAATGI